jgi:hypothetical protein
MHQADDLESISDLTREALTHAAAIQAAIAAAADYMAYYKAHASLSLALAQIAQTCAAGQSRVAQFDKLMREE